MANESTCHMTSKRRLIDANALNWGRCPTDGKLAKAWLDEAPTVDAVEVVHGRWVHPKGYVVSNGFLCSECGYEKASYHPINPRQGGCCVADENGNFFYPPNMNYCPNCGAKMDGDGNEKP